MAGGVQLAATGRQRHPPRMYRTFSCGVGMIIALPADQLDKALALLRAEGENAWPSATSPRRPMVRTGHHSMNDRINGQMASL